MRALNQKIVIVAILAFLSLETAQGATWVTKRLTNNKGDSENPAIAVNGSNLYVVWSDETPGKYGIYFLRSGSGGKTWKAPQRLTENYVFYKDPAIAVNESSVYVVWSDSPPEKPETEIYFLRSTDGGETWKAPKRLTNTSRTSCDPSIAVDGSNLYVVWVDITPGNPEIYFIRSSDGGKTWKAPKRLTDNKGESNGPAIITNGLNLYVFWSDNSPDDYEIYFLRSTDGGKTWQSPKRLTNQPGNSWSPSIAVNEPNLYVVWWDGGDLSWNIYFLRSTNGGTTWESPQNLTNFYGILHPPSIAVEGSNLYVVWPKRTVPAYFELYLLKSANGGMTWKAPQRLTNNSGNSISPAISVNGSNLYVVWSDYTPGNFEIYFMRSTNGGAMMRGGQED
jgi:Tol biopolymer transport system component